MAEIFTVTVELDLKPDEADKFCDVVLPELQKQTRAFDGVASARAVRQTEHPSKVLFIDEFASKDAADAYFAWRASTGDLDYLATLVTQPPIIQYWPRRVGSDG